MTAPRAAPGGLAREDKPLYSRGYRVAPVFSGGRALMLPFVGVLTSLLVSLAVRIYLHFFSSLGAPNPAFEQWCASRPLVFAFFCPRASTSPLLEALVSALHGREFLNVEGPFPWAFYRIKVEVEALDASVVGVRFAGCALLRGNQRRPPLLPAVLDACARAAGVEEIWLHRDMYSDGTPLDPETTWRGRPPLPPTFHAFAELPFWLRRFERRGPPNRRQRDGEAPVSLTPALATPPASIP